MIGFRLNDGGCELIGGDCVVRATAIYTQIPYETLFPHFQKFNIDSRGNPKGIYSGGLKSEGGVFNHSRNTVFEKIGLVRFPGRRPDGTLLTYSQAYNVYGDCIVKTRRHIAAIVDGNLNDRFDGRYADWPVPICNNCMHVDRVAINGHQRLMPNDIIDASSTVGYKWDCKCHCCERYGPSLPLYKLSAERKATSIWILPDCKRSKVPVHLDKRQVARKTERNKLITTDGIKACSRCDIVLPATSEWFEKDNRTRTGLGPRCKQCKRGRR